MAVDCRSCAGIFELKAECAGEGGQRSVISECHCVGDCVDLAIGNRWWCKIVEYNHKVIVDGICAYGDRQEAWSGNCSKRHSLFSTNAFGVGASRIYAVGEGAHIDLSVG